ncbi:TetR/AcrR family transcriptional regulator [Janthinobacterium fluminis]|uniref:TetR/AcrR family transcriptional regulator n=1 Tax=Janthinobacterium fluminis TaxID=2987524 RepID=A0ABT5JV97_9BURK|nr:TetR/AcrR family transcriptional regulator [Janthinobacterium fluminis]MDC8756648.1 TetR/AcrR family transcriptional regulator [Janthinobacterium fluminis]
MTAQQTCGAAADGNRRAELVRAAARLFRDRGYDGTSIRDIADAVGMRSGSPFYHFKSKQEILAAVMEEGLLSCLPAVEGIVAGALPPRQKFRALLRAHLETVLAEGHDFIPVLLYDWRALSPERRAGIVALRDRYDRVWQAVLTELQRAGMVKSDSKVARLLLMGAINFSIQWYQPGRGCTLDELADEAAGMFLL